MTSTRGLGAQTQLGRRGKAQLLRRGAFRLRGEAARPTTPGPTPKIQRPCVLGSPGRLNSAPQGPLPTGTQLLGRSNATATPELPRGAVRRAGGAAAHSRSPAPRSSMVTHTPAARPFPGPARSATPLPTSPRRCEPTPPGSRPPGRSPGCGGRREAGGASRGGGGSGRAGGRAREQVTAHRAVLFPKYARSGHPANS